MVVYRSRGIVLRSMRYGEADRILDLYTVDRGVVSAIVKGVRRPRSRFGGRLEPLCCVEFLAYRGRTLDTITQAETLRSFRGVKENLARFEAAGRMVRTVRALAGGEADRRVFNLLFHALDALEERDAGFGAVEAAFGIKLLALTGYAPRLDACGVCGRRPEGLVRYSGGLGGVLCEGCARGVGDAFALALGAGQALTSLLSGPMRLAMVEGRVEGSVLRAVREHVLAHAPGASSLERRLRLPA